MKRSTIAGALAMIAMAPLSATAMPHGAMSYEERLAAMEDDMTLPAPIAGVQNKYWFNYRTDVAEARKELAHDLRHATDAEDERDAWDEYRAELADARRDYAKEMREKGYRSGQVRVHGSGR
ncbi:hypothetical protein EWH08_10220 [Sphingobium indicum]|uniref:DUF4148 domain-containing protein n=2 Tax=Sphingobium indicum TaxID=332055 RepID=A0A1L5BRB7_SPHIB|nr:hypothetical protein [Sphingobium indicum]APL95342.1 hypothetical protein SIDU_12915 [Sphingobium indicum B90A]KEY99615.1 hypothetical protein AI27_02330 [Sphingomonas sp. BHC-A]NYI22443.1 hypothetical protein [Sphingobium indicum]RYM02561.1 hypothetical protein EWH08_10220 [Sphingobium indicum]